MKSTSIVMGIVLMSLAATAMAQSDAQKAFEQIKALEGTWEGRLTVDPPDPDVDGKKYARISLRVTSMGNAVLHEMQIEGLPDRPITMIYVDGDQLELTHYCDAGNRPRMVGKTSPGGNDVAFSFVDLSGGNQYGHMHAAAFDFVDADHHVEEWTYMKPGDKPVRARFDLQRVK